MWRNFKIRTKMMIGFASILIVFALSVMITWGYTKVVEGGNRFIIDKVLPAQGLTSHIDEASYELFLAVRAFQYLETDETVADVEKRRADVQKIIDDISAFYTASPEVRATAYLSEKVLPKLKSYFESIDKSLQIRTVKNAAFNEIGDFGNSLSEAADSLKKLLYAYSKNAAPTADAAMRVKHLETVEQVGKLEIMIGTTRRELLRATSARSVSGLNANLKEFDAIDAEIDVLKSMLAVPERRRTADEMKGDVDGYRKAIQVFLTALKEMEDATNVRDSLYSEVNTETSNALRISQERIDELSKISIQDLNLAVMVLFFSAALSILLGIGIAFFIARSIANPLATIVTLAKRAGEGDLTVTQEDFQYEGKDELGELVRATSTMISSQGDTIRQVITVSDSLASSAGSLSAISEETNASMEEVKASIDQVSTLSENNGAALEECNAGVEEMSAGADTVAQSATDSAAFISQTTDASNRAIQTVNKVIAGMYEVDANSKESENKIKQLVTSVENVSSFVSVITGIADQTNLLALNAAIEAARAGEVGRGFAVVAEEVRKLAEESAEAAQNVNNIIVELQGEAQESIRATAGAGQMLSDMLTHAKQAEEELKEALTEMNKANDSIQNIAAIAEEQAASSKEVATAIDNSTKGTMEIVDTISTIRKATDETAQAAQGVAVQSEAMNNHAENLVGLLSHFKLQRNAGASSSGKQKTAKLKALPG